MSEFDSNINDLLCTAKAFGELREDVVFLGGTAVALLITDAGAPPIRITDDVDCIIEVTSRWDYYALEKKLATKGIHVDPDGPTCRFLLEGIKIDVMPTSEEILGYANRWSSEAIERSAPHSLNAKIEIRLITSPYFLGTKLEAFFGRGGGDYRLSKDVEDIVAVVDGRPELISEIRQDGTPQLKDYLKKKFSSIKEPFFESVPGHLGDESERTILVKERIAEIIRL